MSIRLIEISYWPCVDRPLLLYTPCQRLAIKLVKQVSRLYGLQLKARSHLPS